MDKGKADVVLVDDDDDDFVTQVAKKLTAKRIAKDVQVCSASSSDDFVTQNPRDSSGNFFGYFK